MNDGISLMQPPHLVAQRSRRRGLPLKLDSETDLPEASSNTKFGAGLRADCGSTPTRISAACASEHAVRQMISVRINPNHYTAVPVWKLNLRFLDAPLGSWAGRRRPELNLTGNARLVEIEPKEREVRFEENWRDDA